jgi:hypothetical protein
MNGSVRVGKGRIYIYNRIGPLEFELIYLFIKKTSPALINK